MLGTNNKYKKLNLSAKKRLGLILLSLIVLSSTSCSKTPIIRNPYISDVPINYQVNLNLPQYDQLRFVGGSAYIYQAGLKGVLLYNLNGRTFLAWEATCPNHTPRSCSLLELNTSLAQCSCENFQYSLANGQLLNADENANTSYPLINYQVEVYDSFLTIRN